MSDLSGSPSPFPERNGEVGVAKAPVETPATTATTETTNQTTYPFLVHSQDTLPNNLPPEVDNKSLARQKRKRTSPEDQLILETEYLRNQKPDKRARAEIVERVALGEKEVQIWFQNRRQSTRRKAQPLSAADLLLIQPFGSVGSGNDAEDGFTSTPPLKEKEHNELDKMPGPQEKGSRVSESRSFKSEGREEARQTDHGADCLLIARDDSLQAALKLIHGSKIPQNSNISKAISRKPTTTDSFWLTSSKATTTHDRSFGKDLTNSAASHAQCSIQGSTKFPGVPGYLANRRNVSLSYSKSDYDLSLYTSPQPSSQQTIIEKESSQGDDTPSLKKTILQTRFTIALDGTASAILAEDPPSPPKRNPTMSLATTGRPGLLKRSQSELGLGTMMKHSVDQKENIIPMPRRMPSRRSGDSRAWYHCADKEARNALSVKAEQERSGSAAGAIGMLRSMSSGALNLMANKRKVQASKHNTFKSRKPMTEVAQEKPELSLPSTSVACFHPVNNTVFKQVVKGNTNKTMTSGSKIRESPSTDSDKENWVPGTREANSSKRRSAQSLGDVSKRQRVLTENTTIPSHNTSLGVLMDRERKDKPTADAEILNEDEDPEKDPEVAAFMAGSCEPENADMVCVEHLLSLSQGSWR